YESAFKSQRLQNWCEAKHFNGRPSAQVGHTTFIADNRGHLLPGVVKRGSAWPDFKGTWDLPARIPARSINPTSRSVEGLSRLRSWGFDPQHTGKSQPHRGSRDTNRPQQDVGEQTDVDVQQDGAAATSSAAEAQPASQNRPDTGGQRTASQNQDLTAAVVGSVGQPAEEKQAAREGTNSRPDTGRPVSNVAENEAKPVTPSSSRQRHREAQQDQ
ncbi:hypothetical protein L3Q82_015535, partial [Scortum barcoo]